MPPPTAGAAVPFRSSPLNNDRREYLSWFALGAVIGSLVIGAVAVLAASGICNENCSHVPWQRAGELWAAAGLGVVAVAAFFSSITRRPGLALRLLWAWLLLLAVWVALLDSAT